MKLYKTKASKATDKRKRQGKAEDKNSFEISSQTQARDVLATIDENFCFITKILGEDIGLVTGRFEILGGRACAGVVYIESIANAELINRLVIEPLLKGVIGTDMPVDDILLIIRSRFIPSAGTSMSSSMEQVVDSLLNGDMVLFLDGTGTALIVGSRRIESRTIESPKNEATLLSSMEAFVEDLETNSSMIIKRLPAPGLRFKNFTIGRRSRTRIKLVWFEGIANPEIVEEACRRVARIDVDFVDNIGILSELIEDKPLSIFPKYRQTERPDLSAKKLSEGFLIMLCSNSPFAFLFPSSLWDNFKSMDDYSETPVKSSYLRLIRYVAFTISILVSPLYLSFVTYNHSVTPPSLAVNIAMGRMGVPFPTIVEILIMTVTIGIIREAGIRMPGVVGYFIGTLGAVIIGQAAVTAGYVSASLIIVIAGSAISTFAISSTTLINTSRLLNYFLIMLSGIFGVFGLLCGIILITYHMVNLESFGIPYMYPLVPFEGEGLKDLLIRMPYSNLRKRLKFLAPVNRRSIGGKRWNR